MIYLTWQRDPTTTMTVHWLSADPRAASRVEYHEADVIGVVGQKAVEGTSRPMKHSDYLIHTVELTGLEPDTAYTFRVAGEERDNRFRTMPAEPTRPIRFVESGDVLRDSELFVRMNKLVAQRDPDFVIFGGDIAHDNGVPEGAGSWAHFFALWQQTMITPDGRMVPLVTTIGNHEVPNGGHGRPPSEVLFYYDLFAFPGTDGRGVLDFGEYLSIVALDTNHTHGLEGEQLDWLEKTLAVRAGQTHVFCVYHVPAWPAARHPINPPNRHIREVWVPVFEKHGVDICFEHHDHTMKRTHPIRDGRIDPLGVVYLGDGGYALGETRRPKAPGSWWNGGRWYLAHAAQTNFFWWVTIDGDTRTFEAIDPTGSVIDRYSQVEGVNAMVTPAAGQGKAPLGVVIVLWTLGVVTLLVAIKLIADGMFASKAAKRIRAASSDTA